MTSTIPHESAPPTANRKLIEWVEQWKASNDPSGRFISSHDAATDHANGNGVAAVANGHGPANGAVNGGEVAVANGHGAANGNEVAVAIAV